MPWLRRAASQRDAVLVLLSVYLLGTLVFSAFPDGPEKQSVGSFAEERRKSLRKRYSPERWSREVEKAKNDVHVVILSRLIDDAGRWLFDSPNN